jgi:hypothetical protein
LYVLVSESWWPLVFHVTVFEFLGGVGLVMWWPSNFWEVFYILFFIPHSTILGQKFGGKNKNHIFQISRKEKSHLLTP